MSWPSGYAWPSVVRITTICRLPNRLPDCALGAIGALDLIYLPPEETVYDSLYEGLIFFRINPLGAYLFGQAGEYASPRPLGDPLFSIDSELVLTLDDPAALTPDLRLELGRFTVEQGNHRYRLDTGSVLDE